MESYRFYKVLSLVVVILGSIMASPLNAQTCSKTIKGKTYIFADRMIYNKDNNPSSRVVETEGFEVKNYLMVPKRSSNFFRLKELKS